MTAPTAFHVVAKPRGAMCNLDCDYCFYLVKKSLYAGSSFRMSDDLLEEFVKQFLYAHATPEVVFDWQGGEPTLMGVDFFRRVVRLQEKHNRRGAAVRNSFQTNGTLLDHEWCTFLSENEFLVGVSLDGPRNVHDTFRRDRGGAPTFDKVTAGIELLKDHGVEFNILAAVHSANAGRGVEVYRFFRDEVRAQVIQFIPIVEPVPGGTKGEVTERSVTGKGYGMFLIDVFDEWVKHDVGKTFVQIFDVALGIWLGHPSSLCVFLETCGTAPTLEHNGDLYSCDHFVDETHRLGNIASTPLKELIAAPFQKDFGNAKRDSLPACCRRCEMLFVCNGGCPKDRIRTSPEGEPGLNHLCKGYRAFFSHIAPTMRMMADSLRD